jgi:hypothetical protein
MEYYKAYEISTATHKYPFELFSLIKTQPSIWYYLMKFISSYEEWKV